MKNVKANIKKFLKDESGQGTVEYILILVGVLALGFIFKEQITEAISGKMSELKGNINDFKPR